VKAGMLVFNPSRSTALSLSIESPSVMLDA
jgi:hypothetical protein